MVEIKSLFLKEICLLLKQNGFDGKTKNQSVILKFDKGLKAILFAFVKYGEKIEVSVSVGIRFDEIESLVHYDNPFLKNKNLLTYTLGTNIANLTSSNNLNWDISSEDLVNKHTPEILEKVLTYGFPYLEKYSVPENAAKEFYVENNFSKALSLFPHERASRAVAFAYALEGKDFAETIFKQKLEFLKKINVNENDINRFIGIVKKNMLT